MKNVIPLNTGKVQIGLMYQPRPEYRQDLDAWLFQTALLSKFNPRRFFRTRSNNYWFL